MEAIKPTSKFEFKLLLQEEWAKAEKMLLFWPENFVTCDVCNKRMRGRHFVHGFLDKHVEFVNMCPRCHNHYGNGLGEGKGATLIRD
jgi:hypothetical protein